MIKKNIICKKGITLISLVLTIIILLILSTTVVFSVKSMNKVRPYNNMVADINLLEDKILIYYNKYREIPKTERKISIDGKEYYEISITKLENITLHYGSERGQEGQLQTGKSDVYVVDDSLQVRYLKGAELTGTTYYEN